MKLTIKQTRTKIETLWTKVDFLCRKAKTAIFNEDNVSKAESLHIEAEKFHDRMLEMAAEARDNHGLDDFDEGHYYFVTEAEEALYELGNIIIEKNGG